MQYFITNITEPSTLITDYILGIVSFILAIKLYLKSQNPKRPFLISWVITLCFLSLTSIVGGTYHGFLTLLSQDQLTFLWIITLVAASLTSYLLLQSGAITVLRKPISSILIGAAVIKFLIFIYPLLSTQDFRFIIYDNAISVVIVIALFIYNVMRNRERKSSLQIIAGLIIIILASIVQQTGLSFHQYFNHNDLYHVIQIIAIITLYRGVSTIQINSTSKQRLIKDVS